jgi:uncharacterized protein (TIGR02117 family)
MMLMTLALSACASVPPRAAIEPSPPADHSWTILVVRRGWHTDVGFLAAEIAPPLASVRAQFGDAHYLTFGFGDRRYLLARTSRSVDLIGAVWPGDGLILTTALQASAQAAFGAGNVAAIAVSRAQARDAQAFIWQSMRKQGGGALLVGAGPYRGSGYYAATERYSGLYTCNSWAAQALRAAGLPIRNTGVIFAWQLWRQVLRLAAQSGRQAHGQGRADLARAHRSTH